MHFSVFIGRIQYSLVTARYSAQPVKDFRPELRQNRSFIELFNKIKFGTIHTLPR